MAANGKNGAAKDPVLVVVQLSGGNDFMNTLIPFTAGMYYDNRPLVGIPQQKVLPVNDTLAFHPSAAPMKQMFEDGKWRWSRASATRTCRGPTSARWISGTRASP